MSPVTSLTYLQEYAIQTRFEAHCHDDAEIAAALGIGVAIAPVVAHTRAAG